ncbi:MAG: hypothetical protein V4504_01170 [Patescibacteria group bacterium]
MKYVIFRLKATCVVCSNEHHILHKFFLHVTANHSNGVYGPGHSSWQDKEILQTYFCEKCGIVYEPTEANKLEGDINHKMALAQEKFNSVKYMSFTPKKILIIDENEIKDA